MAPQPPPRASSPTVLSVVGNRPQFVKAAPLSRALRARTREVLVHTGQHYDPELADLIMGELGVPEPEHALGIGPGSPTAQLAAILTGLEPLVESERPGAMVVYGDTTTTLGAALAASKMGVPLAHVEAGLRSFNRSMPEEHNRVVTDHLSDLLLCPTDQAVRNLRAEGIAEGVLRVGDVMYDAALMFADAARALPGPAAHAVRPGEYVVMTVHRAASTTSEGLLRLVEVIRAISLPILFPVHPRTESRLREDGLWEGLAAREGVHLLPSIGYLEFTALLMSAAAVLTDSGGVQKEAFFHRVPCITMRDETEWVETVEAGANRVTGLDAAAVTRALDDLGMPDDLPQPYGDGHAADEMAEAIIALAER
jgi:UDP-N-acetylglucosamine 2-epimerase